MLLFGKIDLNSVACEMTLKKACYSLIFFLYFSWCRLDLFITAERIGAKTRRWGIFLSTATWTVRRRLRPPRRACTCQLSPQLDRRRQPLHTDLHTVTQSRLVSQP